MSRILLVDDEPDYRRLLRLGIGGSHQFDESEGALAALERLDRTAYDIVLSDLHMPPGPDGIELLREARRREVDCPFVLLTGQATVETAVQAMREGAFDYLRKSASPPEIRAVVTRALEHGRMARELARLRTEVEAAVGGQRIIGDSAASRRVMALAERVAAADASVLILGESGTGKELLARAIHRFSTRASGPFVAFDCSALTPSLVDSELFGHEKGAFTGAVRARRGLLREAHGGTLFLDEIGDIPPDVQNKLLRVLQEREIKPVGGDSFVKIDVRLIAATNKNLKALVAEKKFREDLYYRLAVVPIEVPPLRDRASDIPLLVEHFLERGRRRGADARPLTVAPAAMDMLTAWRWPGNIRELENVIERAAILCDGGEILPVDLPLMELRQPAAAPASGVNVTGRPDPSDREADTAAPSARSQASPSPTDGAATPSASTRATPAAPDPPNPAEALDLDRPLKDLLDDATRRIEREAILAAIRAESGSPTRAARRLGISRAAFYNKVKRHRIDL